MRNGAIKFDCSHIVRFYASFAAYATNQKSVVLLFYLIYIRRVQYYISRKEKIDRVLRIVNIFLEWLPPP